MSVENFQCRVCERVFEGAAREMCFACLATNIRASLSGMDSRPAAVPRPLAQKNAQSVSPRSTQVRGKRAKKESSAPSRKRDVASDETRVHNRVRHAPQSRRLRAISCVLCGELVEPGGLLNHKAAVHGERTVVASKARPQSKPAWVVVLPGGLPGLGKRR